MERTEKLDIKTKFAIGTAVIALDSGPGPGLYGQCPGDWDVL